jgi:hypothetical protein
MRPGIERPFVAKNGDAAEKDRRFGGKNGASLR